MNHKAKVFSIRRSGTSQIIATKTYTAQAIHAFTKQRGIAAAYNINDIFPLKSLPSAIARTESFVCIERRARVKMKYAIAENNKTIPYKATGQDAK